MSLLLVPVFCAVGMLSAQASNLYSVDSQGVKLLSRSQQNMLNTSKWWDSTWKTMLTGEGNSLSNQALYQFLFPFLLVVLLLFLGRAGLDYFQGNFLQGFNRSVIPVLILSLFLLNYGFASKAVAYGTRSLMTFGTDLILKGELSDIQFREAINDQVFSLEFKQDLAAGQKNCNSLPTPNLKIASEFDSDPDSVSPQEARTLNALSCTQSLLAYVREKRSAIKTACPTCKTADQVTKRAEEGLLGQIKIFGQLFLGEAASPYQSASFEDLSDDLDVGAALITQFWFVSGQEFMLYLAAYLAPVMVLYASLPLPGQTGIPITYFSAFVIIALTRLAYVLLIALGAAFLSSNPPAEGAEYWASWLGIYAPIISTAAVTGGVIAAVHAWSGSLIATAAAGISLISSGVGSAVSSFQQRDLRNR